jgi:tetratricopeptide (TPR) repeat protein
MFWQQGPLANQYYPIGLRQKKAQVLELVGQWEEEEDALRENLRCAIELGDRALIARCEYDLGGVLYLKGANALALALYQQAYDRYQERSDAAGIGLVAGNMGCVYRELGDFTRAMECFQEQLRLARQEQDSTGMSRAYGYLGILHCLQGQFGQAMGYFQQKLELVEGLADQEAIGATVGNMGNVYKMLGDEQKALECYDRQLEIARRLGDRRSIGVAVGNSGVIHNDQGNYQKAIVSFRTFLEMASGLGDKRGIGVASGNLGIAYKRVNDYTNSEKYYDLAIATGRELNSRQYLCRYLSDKADLYYLLGRLAEAGELIAEALGIAENVGDQSEIFNCRVISARIGAADGKKGSAKILQDLLPEAEDEYQKAELNHDLFRLTGEDSYRVEALHSYRTLLEERPRPEYRARISELE